MYDLPLRVFHSVFAFCFIVAFIVAKNSSDESSVFAVHMLAGALMSVSIFFRIYWGIAGTKYSLFKNFDLSFSNLKSYLVNLKNKNSVLYTGHNPASSFAAITMMACGVVLGISGINMVMKNYKYIFEEVHEFSATIFLVFAILHICGVALHSMKYRDQLFLTMFNGKKVSNIREDIENKTFVGLVFILILLVVSVFLISSYSTKNGNIYLFHKTYKLIDLEEDDS